jgi:hypothetical protein
MSSENESSAESEQENQLDQAPKEIVKRRSVFTGRDKQALNDALTRFTSCSRCSLFLAAYRLNYDDVDLQTAVNSVDGGWLKLPWDPSIPELINKSYNCRVDIEGYHFESCCPECHVPFVYSEPDISQPFTFRIKM